MMSKTFVQRARSSLVGAMLAATAFNVAQASNNPLTSPYQLRVTASTPAAIFGKVRLSEPGPPVVLTTRIQLRVPMPPELLPRHDVYFCLMAPGQATACLVPAASPSGTTAPGLAEGLVPLARGVVIDENPVTSREWLGGADLSYQFSASDTPGLYLLFSFIVPEGADPADGDQWLMHDSMLLAVTP